MDTLIERNLVINRVLGEKTVYLLDLDAPNLFEAVPAIIQELEKEGGLTESELPIVKRKLLTLLSKGYSEIGQGVALYYKELQDLNKPVQVLLRLKNPISLTDSKEPTTRFVWFLMSPTPRHPLMKAVAEFFHLMDHESFRKDALVAKNAAQLAALYERELNKEVKCISLPDSAEGEAPSGLFAGVLSDLRSRLPYWVNDFTCGFNLKVLASILFMFFACAAPVIAFGALTATLTGGQIGVIETILASAVCGIIWALIGGQPLVIIGPTGPNIIFTGILFTLCQRLDLPFLPVTFWVGMWTMVMLFILAATNASVLIRYFTRFTDEIFAALISLIFVSEAITDMFRVFQSETTGQDTALLSLFLGLGTFGIAITLSRIRRSPYLRHYIREFLSDFGPTISLVIMTLVAYYFSDIEFEHLSVPDTFRASIDRPWLIDPFQVPAWVWGASAIPAALLTILIWINQNITSRLVNSVDHKLQKPTSYHWDIAIVGVLIGILSCFGLPWVVGAAVRSLNHVRSLLIMQGEKILGAVENRLSNLVVHIMILGTLSALTLIQYMPMAVLFGMFLFMGIGSMGGNQLIARLRLWFVDPAHFRPTHYQRAVPVSVIHAYTILQFACLALLWIVKSSFLGILFPLFVALLVPVRMFLGKIFEPEYVALLDIEEGPEDERFREFGV